MRSLFSGNYNTVFTRFVGTFLIAFVFISAVILYIQERKFSKIYFDQIIAQEIMENFSAIDRFHEQLASVEKLASYLGTATYNMPRDAMLLRRVLPHLLTGGNQIQLPLVSGGGIWPEPHVFDEDLERMGFYWTVNVWGDLKEKTFFNLPSEPSYHKKEWYLLGKEMKGEGCYWSGAYVSPYSGKPTMTCATPVYDETGSVWGVATVDLLLEGFEALLSSSLSLYDGHAFILDRGNTLVAYPRYKDIKFQKGKTPLESIAAVTERIPAMTPIKNILEDVNYTLLGKFRSMILEGDVNLEEANVLNFVEPLDGETEYDAAGLELIQSSLKVDSDQLYKRVSDNLLEVLSFTLDKDPLTGVNAQVVVYLVPNTFWKVVLVLPLEHTQELVRGGMRFVKL